MVRGNPDYSCAGDNRVRPIAMDCGGDNRRVRMHLRRTKAAFLPRLTTILEASDPGSGVTSLDLTLGGGEVMSATTVAIPVASAMTLERAAVSFLTSNTPGDWTLRIYKRNASGTTQVAELDCATS